MYSLATLVIAIQEISRGSSCLPVVACRGRRPDAARSRRATRPPPQAPAIVRYPDPSVRSLDPRFDKYRVGAAVVERLYTGCRWAEGPVWFGDLRLPAVERHPQ